MKETWKPVHGWPNYEASTFGRVRRVNGGRGVRGENYVLKPQRGLNDYYFIYLRREGKKHILGVHQAVALAFIGPCPKGNEVSHADHNRANNVLTNLSYLTKLENIQLSTRAGRMNRGAAHGNAKLTTANVEHIRLWRAAGTGLQEIADKYGLAVQTVSNIALRKRWAWL